MEIQRPFNFRILDEGVDVEERYNAEHWWVDGDGKAWVRLKGSQTIHQVLGCNVTLIFPMQGPINNGE